jgi:hypothetical protein
MNRERVLKAAYFAVLAMEQEPSQRSIQAMTKRICGKTMQTKDVLAFLRSVAPQLRSSSDPVATNERKMDDLVAVQKRASSPRARVVKDLDLELDLLTPSGVSLPERVLAPKTKPAVIQPWVTDLRRQMNTIARHRLCDLDVSDRVTVSRFFVLAGHGISADEAKNRARAAAFVGKFAAMGRHRELGQLTVREYFDALAVVAEHTQQRFVRDPWAVQAGLDYAEVPA